MAFDALPPQSPRTPENTRVPEAATAYAETALARSRAAAAALSPTMDVAFGGDVYQTLDIYAGPGTGDERPKPVLVFLHGGAWGHGYKEWNGFMAPVLVDLPAVFVSLNYRLAPAHKWPAPRNDAFAGLRWVHDNIADFGGDPRRIHVAGWSAGGTLASLLALRTDLYPQFGLPGDVAKSCMVTSTSFAFRNGDMAPGTRNVTYRDFLFAADDDESDASPIDHAAGNRVPFFIAYGENDFAHVKTTARDMMPALEAAGAEVVERVYPGLDHYGMNLAQGDSAHDWVQTARRWLGRS